MEDRSRNILIRVYLVYVIMLLFSIIITTKIVRIQFVEAGELMPSESNGKTGNARYRTIEANRGSIYSADGKLMATSVPMFDIRMDMAVPSITEQIFAEKLDSLATGLADLFKDRSIIEYRQLLIKGRRDKNRYLLIRRNVNYDQLTVLRSLPIFRKGRFGGGFIAEPKEKREKPYRELASRTIGRDKHGTELDVGLEGAYSEVLGGIDGMQLIKRLPNGVWRPVTTAYLVDPQHGMDVHTTIDMFIQDIAHNALLNQLKKSNAEHGCVIVMETATGHIKAIANLQRSPKDSIYRERYNHAIGERYEPGSTFKLASVMAALEDGIINLNDTVDIGDGTTTYTREEIKMTDVASNEKGRISVSRAFEISSNVGISKSIVAAYGNKPSKFTDRIFKMGLGRQLGIEIAGEGRAEIKTPQCQTWWETSLPWMSIGYELRLTPIQLLTFYNAVANKGKMMKPQFVTHISRTGNTVKEFNPTVLIEKIASKKTIREAHDMLVRVVDHGTASNIRNDIYKIAGKTGTAKIAKGTEGYKTPDYVASFVGYFPADNPRYSCIVVINRPEGQYYGGQIAAPVFKSIADILYASYVDHIHQTNFTFRKFTFPNTGAGLKQEKKKLLNILGINIIDTIPDSKKWVNGRTGKDAIIFKNRNISKGIMPNLMGMTIRDVLFLLERQGVKVEFIGKGRVIGQSISEGTKIKRGDTVKVRLEL